MHANCAGLRGVAVLVLFGCFLSGARARAAEPFVNLGFTSFVDGFGDPTQDGFTVVQYFRYARSTSVRDSGGDEVAAFVDPRLNAYISVTQLLYTFKKPRGFGLSVLVPAVVLDAEFGAGGAALLENSVGVGDVFVGPALQFPPVSIGGRPALFHRFEFDVVLPIGDYDRGKQINQGNNAWSLNPFWAATLLAGPKVEVSCRLHYLYNFENPDPVFSPPGTAALTSTRAGQAVHANVSTSLEVVPKALRVGVSSYFFRQFTDAEVNGASIPDSQEQVLGVGPGLVWFPSPVDLVFVNFYYETAVRNRFQTHSAQLRWGHAFEGF